MSGRILHAIAFAWLRLELERETDDGDIVARVIIGGISGLSVEIARLHLDALDDDAAALISNELVVQTLEQHGAQQRNPRALDS